MPEVIEKIAATAERIPFNDLAIQWREIAAEVERDFAEIFATSTYSSGPFVDMLEQEIGAFLSCPNALAVNSGTSALHLAMLAANLGPGDQVLVPAHTFIGTLWGVLYVGAQPVLCDVDDQTGTIDAEDAARRVTHRTKAIIPVHLYGQPANMEAVLQFARRRGLIVIEDAAQAIGARWNGAHVGTLGHVGCFSFYPGKNLGAAGEAGLVISSDATIIERLRSLRSHGQRERYLHEEVGFNYRMDGMQGAVLRRKLMRLGAWTQRRRELAQRYRSGLAGLPLDVPAVHNQDHVWHLFVVRTAKRDPLREHLSKAEIETGLHYPVPLHRQPCLSRFVSDPSSFPCSDRWASQGLSLPLFYGMKDQQVDRVVEAVREFFEHS